jgi:hypothetical protein
MSEAPGSIKARSCSVDEIAAEVASLIQPAYRLQASAGRAPLPNNKWVYPGNFVATPSLYLRARKRHK